MAHLAQHLDPGLHLYSAGRQPARTVAQGVQRFCRDGVMRSLAWIGVEFCALGSLSWSGAGTGWRCSAAKTADRRTPRRVLDVLRGDDDGNLFCLARHLVAGYHVIRSTRLAAILLS